MTSIYVKKGINALILLAIAVVLSLFETYTQDDFCVRDCKSVISQMNLSLPFNALLAFGSDRTLNDAD